MQPPLMMIFLLLCRQTDSVNYELVHHDSESVLSVLFRFGAVHPFAASNQFDGQQVGFGDVGGRRRC